MDLTIYRAQTKSLILQKQLPDLLDQLPHSLHSKALRYKSELSSYNYVVGRLLLKQGLEFLGLNNDLEKIKIQENGKPVIPEIHFNISHSEHQVICAFSRGGSIGVDLEKINPIDFEDFTSMFSAKEWTTIKGAKDPIQTFYWFWTRKESIIKALGWNLSYLHQIELDVSLDHFIVDGKPWYLRDISVENGFIGAVCSETRIEKVNLIEIDFGK